MIRKTLLVALAMSLAGSAARAQEARFEISGTAGWTFSDGVSGDAVTVPDVGSFNRIDPKDAFSWGLRFGFLLARNYEIGALFDVQSTELELGGTETVKLADETIYNYHGYFSYSFDVDAAVRPYLLIGLGATHYGGIDATLGDEQRSIGGETRFSGTGALGIKVFPFASPKFGLRAEARYTPTYIKSEAAGWWCGFYGCYVVQDAQYSNQFELLGGVILRL